MKRKRDPLELSSSWHVDCRIEAELPEDNLVGRRFLVHAAATVVLAGVLLYAGLLSFVALSLQRQIDDWEMRLTENRAEIREIQRMQREYATESAKIDEAYLLARPRVQVSQLLADIGRTRPDQMAIDLVEWNDSAVVIRGSLNETSERAARLLGGYVEQLRRHERIAPLFKEIRLTDLDRGGSGGGMRFEINCALNPSGT